MFVIRPDAELTTSDLCRGAYPRAGGVITDNQRRSVRGAALASAAPIVGAPEQAGADHCSGGQNRQANIPGLPGYATEGRRPDITPINTQKPLSTNQGLGCFTFVRPTFKHVCAAAGATASVAYQW